MIANGVNLTNLIGFMRIFIFTIIICIPFLSSCSFLGSSEDSGVYTKSPFIKSNYVLNNWKTSLKQKGADLVLEKKKSQSLMVLNSNCRKNQFTSLTNLKNALMSGIDQIEIIEEKMTTLHDRETSETSFTGSVDGVRRFMKLIVFQRDYCIYDLILISNNHKNFENDKKDFEQFSTNVFNFEITP